MYKYLLLLSVLTLASPSLHAEEPSLTDKIIDLLGGDKNKAAPIPAEKAEKPAEKEAIPAKEAEKSEEKAEKPAEKAATSAKQEESPQENSSSTDEQEGIATAIAPGETQSTPESPGKTDAVAPESQRSDLSGITDPKIKSCAQTYDAALAQCGADENCKLESRHALKGCIRPEVARKHMYAFAGLFNQADQAFNGAPFYRACADTFSRLQPQCNGNKGCEEVLYYSLHNNCGKRLFHKGYIKNRASTYETFVMKKTAEPSPPPAEQSVTKEADSPAETRVAEPSEDEKEPKPTEESSPAKTEGA